MGSGVLVAPLSKRTKRFFSRRGPTLLGTIMYREFVTNRHQAGLVSLDRLRRPFWTLFRFFISIPKGSRPRLNKPNSMHFYSKSSNLQ